MKEPGWENAAAGKQLYCKCVWRDYWSARGIGTWLLSCLTRKLESPRPRRILCNTWLVFEVRPRRPDHTVMDVLGVDNLPYTQIHVECVRVSARRRPKEAMLPLLTCRQLALAERNHDEGNAAGVGYCNVRDIRGTKL